MSKYFGLQLVTHLFVLESGMYPVEHAFTETQACFNVSYTAEQDAAAIHFQVDLSATNPVVHCEKITQLF